MSRTRRKTDIGDTPDKDTGYTRNKRKRDIGQNKKIKKDYLKYRDEDE